MPIELPAAFGPPLDSGPPTIEMLQLEIAQLRLKLAAVEQKSAAADSTLAAEQARYEASRASLQLQLEQALGT